MNISERDRPAIEKIISTFQDDDWLDIEKETDRINTICGNPHLYLYPNLRSEFDDGLMEFASFDYEEQERERESRWDYIENLVKYQKAIDIYFRSMEYQEAI